MTWLLWLNNLSSLLVVFTCWWLAHSYARSGGWARLIATGFCLLGLSVLATMWVRNFTTDPPTLVPWFIVATKTLMGGTLLGIIVHRSHRREVPA